MAWSGLTLTVDGRQALTDAQMSNVINFKAIVIGDGAPPTNFNTQKSLVHQLYEITDIDVEASEEGCTITGDFPIVDYDYYFKEIGLLVTTNNGDKLYVYDNCGDDAQYIVSTTGVETNRKRIRLSLIISNVAEITVSTPSILYVDYATYKKDLSKLVHNDGGDISKTISSVTEPSDDVKYPEIPSSNGVVNIILGNLTRWVKSLKLDKVDSIGGDTADTLVSAFDASSDSFPVPAAKEKARTRWGKMKKFTEDFKNWMTGVCLIGQIVNNCVTDRTDLPLSAAQGKVLMDLYTVLNTKAAKTDKINTFTEQQYLDSGLFGSKVENAAFVIRARTDINPDARPSMYLDCYGTGGVVLFLDTDMQLKLVANNTIKTVVTK